MSKLKLNQNVTGNRFRIAKNLNFRSRFICPGGWNFKSFYLCGSGGKRNVNIFQLGFGAML